MKILPFVVCGLILGILAVCELASPAAAPAQPAADGSTGGAGADALPSLAQGNHRINDLAPVVQVLVGPGDRVKKGQVLVKLFDLEPQAKLRAREKDLRSIEARAQYSRRNFELAEKGRVTGAITRKHLQRNSRHGLEQRGADASR